MQFLLPLHKQKVKYMKKSILLLLAISLFSQYAISSDKNDKTPVARRITILATGGTIAGAAPSATQASYKPGQLSVEHIISSVPNIEKLAQIKGIQVANIASQDMNIGTWIKLHHIIDSLFTNNLTDGVVITHGTDTMEETTFFLNYTVKHKQPVVLVGAMRPASSISADGPMNLYKAVALASSEEAIGRGVMIFMNDNIFSAEDVSKQHTTNVDAFGSINYGRLGYIKEATPTFVREQKAGHTYQSPFDIKGLKTLPQVEIISAYSDASPIAFEALIDAGIDGIVISGVGHGNYNRAYAQAIEKAITKGIIVVRSTRILKGGVNMHAEEYKPQVPVVYNHTPQTARILLMLLLSQTKDPELIQESFKY